MSAHRRRHRPDRRDRQAVHPRARALAATVDADPRHGAAPVRPRGARLEQDRVPPGRRARPRGRRRARRRAPTSSCTSRSSSSRARDESRDDQPRGLAQRLRGGASARGAKRLVYASSVAAYGFHEDNPQPLTEDVPPRGTDAHPYSRRRRPSSRTLLAEVARRTPTTDAYVFRPVHRRRARGAAADQRDPVRPARPSGCPARCARCSTRCRSSSRCCPTRACRSSSSTTTTSRTRCAPRVLGPRRARRLQPRRRGRDHDARPRRRARLVHGAGARARRRRDRRGRRAAAVPAREASWIEAVRVPVLMDTAKARTQLGWRPRHDALETLRATVEAHREDLSG